MNPKPTLPELNALDRDSFVTLIGPVFEDSPWVAKETWEKRPFANLAELHSALCQTVRDADDERHLALIRAHPDLVGRAAQAGTLAPASAAEQAGAGLNQLSASEISEFQRLNAAYRQKFGFPFVICARLNKKEAILTGFRVRLPNDRSAETQTALEEISKIAYFRLQDIVTF
jgi:2-oxo-4-hydroxy-4-carboxy-5-ureidoimidazoline decarboxylase